MKFLFFVFTICAEIEENFGNEVALEKSFSFPKINIPKQTIKDIVKLPNKGEDLFKLAKLTEICIYPL